ncbi:hypothetical protein DTO10_25100 [Peribacillus butanolivorans]|uniref:Uncharacterized protein n=1 Tax=Peribacillus butanolivorans TaxID=421767 RepID=A0ABM6XRW0_9BACI|nr:hypothetical protein DTO10_25100 [Peribacillus butanolivorans]
MKSQSHKFPTKIGFYLYNWLIFTSLLYANRVTANMQFMYYLCFLFPIIIIYSRF